MRASTISHIITDPAHTASGLQITLTQIRMVTAGCCNSHRIAALAVLAGDPWPRGAPRDGHPRTVSTGSFRPASRAIVALRPLRRTGAGPVASWHREKAKGSSSLARATKAGGDVAPLESELLVRLEPVQRKGSSGRSSWDQ